MISLQNVTKRYGAFKAIQSISLNIKPGEIHGIIGSMAQENLHYCV